LPRDYFALVEHLISHHDVSAFEQYAGKNYQFIPTVDGVQVKDRAASPLSHDE
jgi:hypothetical protein